MLCSYQPDTLTVRASFSVPGKAGVAAVEPQWEAGDRSGRQRKFRMVGKEALVLREPPAAAETAEDNAATAGDDADRTERRPATSGARTARRRMDVVGSDGIAENLVDGGGAERDRLPMSKYARLVHDQPQREAGGFFLCAGAAFNMANTH